MDCYHCEVCDMFIKPKNKFKQLKSSRHKILDKHKHIPSTIDNPDLDNVDKIFCTYINEYDDKYEYYLVRCEFKLVFSNMEGYPVASSILRDNNTMFSWKIFVEKVINNFKNEGYDFSHISQMNIIIVCNKMNMTYNFHLNCNMPAVELRLKALMNRNKSLINKFPQNWIHPLNRKFESYRV